MEIITASHLLNYPDLIKGIDVAVELINLLNVKPCSQKFTKLFELQNEKKTCLKSCLSQIDWQNTDEYLERKDQTDIEMLKRVFLTVYQLLVELNPNQKENNDVVEQEGNPAFTDVVSQHLYSIVLKRLQIRVKPTDHQQKSCFALM